MFMKNLNQKINESLIKSYDTNKLINKIYKRYNNTKFSLYPSKSNESLFLIEFENKEDYEKFLIDIYIQKQLDFFGYYITEKIDKDKLIAIEPNFGTKCTDFVYNKCNGLIFHITSKEKYNVFIKETGLKPFKGKIYRKFTERVFFTCGETKEEIIENIEFLKNQLNQSNIIILMIDLKKHKYNIDFYYDPTEDDWHNFIYCNAWFPITYIDVIKNINDIKLNIDENLNINNSLWRQS